MRSSKSDTIIDKRQSESEATRCWKRRSARFIWAGRAFFVSLGIGLLYAGYHALSFAPALRDAQFQTDTVRQAQGIDAYAAAWRAVAVTWEQRIAEYPVTIFEWLGFFSVFVIVAAVLWLYRDWPQGKPIILRNPEVRRRFDAALALHGHGVRLYERTDSRFDAARSGNKVYLPPVLIEQLVRKRNDTAVQQLLFVLEHEAQHRDALDNIFVAIGRSIILVATVVIAVFTTNFIIAGFAFLFPTSWISVVGNAGTVILVFGAGILFLLATGALINGFNAAFYGVREFFADVIPGARIKTAAAIYAHTDAPDRRGTVLCGWSLPPPPPDRVEHLLGVTPRTAALAAFATALWIALRLLILVVAPASATGLIWGFDLLVLGSLVILLAQLPRRAKGRIDYGLIPWLATFAVIVPLVAAVAGFDYAARHLIKLGALDSSWLAAVIIPPIVVAGALAFYTLRSANRSLPASSPPFNLPRHPQLKRLLLWLFALPSFVVSYLIATYTLYLTATLIMKVSAAVAGAGAWSAIHMVDLVGIVVASVLLGVILRNLSTMSTRSAWSEAALDCFVLGFVVAALALIFQAQAIAVQTSSPLGMPIIKSVLSSAWPTLATLLLTVSAMSAVVLAPSWWARIKVTLPDQPTKPRRTQHGSETA